TRSSVSAPRQAKRTRGKPWSRRASGSMLQACDSRARSRWSTPSARTAMPDGARVVIDASVVVALLQDPALGEGALRDRRFTAPALVFPEVAHALRRLERLGRL